MPSPTSTIAHMHMIPPSLPHLISARLLTPLARYDNEPRLNSLVSIARSKRGAHRVPGVNNSTRRRSCTASCQLGIGTHARDARIDTERNASGLCPGERVYGDGNPALAPPHSPCAPLVLASGPGLTSAATAPTSKSPAERVLSASSSALRTTSPPQPRFARAFEWDLAYRTGSRARCPYRLVAACCFGTRAQHRDPARGWWGSHPEDGP
ncbi:hypothetical protein B0H14DRAFT_3512231 [Mycena olivaceomarginata]|nr:hypothetical protein B0H14DRAFT_3512231 [Mycena olivaceomarginata]